MARCTLDVQVLMDRSTKRIGHQQLHLTDWHLFDVFVLG
jgi:hypothetical protein